MTQLDKLRKLKPYLNMSEVSRQTGITQMNLVHRLNGKRKQGLTELEAIRVGKFLDGIVDIIRGE